MKKIVTLVMATFMILGSVGSANAYNGPRKKAGQDKARAKRLSYCKERKVSKRILRANKAKQRRIALYQ